jgi:hypothetical protein
LFKEDNIPIPCTSPIRRYENVKYFVELFIIFFFSMLPAGSRWGTGLLREYEAEETGNKQQQQQQQQQWNAVTLKCPFTEEQEKEEKQGGSMFLGSSQRVTQRCTQQS